MKEMPTLYGRCHMLSDWSDWDYNVHNDDAQIERQGRALHYPFSFSLDIENRSARFSSTSDLPYYTTTLSCCSCYDFQNRQLPCKHIYRLAVELGVIEILRRPSGGSRYAKEHLDSIRNSEDIHNDPDQLKRQKSSLSPKCKPVEIDYDTKTAVFKGSGKSPYITTPSSCTCRDYFVRRLPCKHIYRLLSELGELIIDPNKFS